ncbi:MAG: hypothetical protein OXG15_07350 [Gammaproteobacteria bacterium]|nr:hypothetical protein [Gammaproteobacteria bacterium]
MAYRKISEMFGCSVGFLAKLRKEGNGDVKEELFVVPSSVEPTPVEPSGDESVFVVKEEPASPDSELTTVTTLTPVEESLEQRLLESVTDDSKTAAITDTIVEAVSRDTINKQSSEETLDYLLEGLGNSSEIRYQTAVMALTSAQSALLIGPNDAATPTKARQG